jgi:citrate lyase subunit beta/citryl-CoA lyase
MIPRSYLYVPGNRPERFTKALGSGTHAVVFDLEDAVPVATKDDALVAVSEALCSQRAWNPELWVRINAGERGLRDLDTIVNFPGLTGILVPKATPDSLRQVVTAAGSVTVSALVESAMGVLHMAVIAGLAGVSQLALGEVDLAADLGMSLSPDGRELESIRINAVVASAAFERLPPVGPVWIDIPDLEGLAGSTRHLRQIGFGARQAIHPSQVEVINAEMSPSSEEMDRATHLLELAALAGGAACLDEEGRMIDEAVLRSARRLLEQ